MSDSDDIAAIAVRRADERREDASRRATEADRARKMASTRLRAAEARIRALEVPRGLRLYTALKAPHNGWAEETLTVEISTRHRWLMRPLVTCSVTANGGSEALNLVLPHQGTDWRRRLDELVRATPSTNDCVDVIKVLAAECLVQSDTVPYGLPAWYATVGNMTGWPLAALTWVVAAYLGGFAGVLLGWLPAWLALALTRRLWPIAIALAIWLWVPKG